MKKNHYSVLRGNSGEWKVASGDAHRSSGSFATKKEAISSARGMANKGATVIVHNKDGKIQNVMGLSHKGIKTVRTGSKLKPRDINIAIATAMEKANVK